MEPMTATLNTAKEIYEAAKTIQKVYNVSKEMETVAESEGKDKLMATKKLAEKAVTINSECGAEKSPISNKELKAKGVFVDMFEPDLTKIKPISDQSLFVDRINPEEFPIDINMSQSLNIGRLDSSAFQNENVKEVVDQQMSGSMTATDTPQEKNLDGLSRSLDNFSEGILPNKEEGLRREAEVEKDLVNKYPESEGYEIVSEAYLRDSEGTIVRDPETSEARRIDFVVVKDGQVFDSIEVTSETADKTIQTAKEERIREAGGNYIRTSDSSLAKFPDDLHTTIERRR